jgi:hypothetical protein
MLAVIVLFIRACRTDIIILAEWDFPALDFTNVYIILCPERVLVMKPDFCDVTPEHAVTDGICTELPAASQWSSKAHIQ